MATSDLLRKLQSIGQESVLRFMSDLSERQQARLIAQLQSLDLDAIPGLVGQYVTGNYTPPIPTHFEPATPLPRTPVTEAQKERYAKARDRGRQLLRDGSVAAFLVAGGQGTRLGYDGPKGEYPVTPIRNKPLFQVFAEQLLAAGRQYAKPLPWYIMTSDTNDAATRAFFLKHNFFGLEPTDVFFFQQGMMPAFGLDGQLLLAERDSLSLSPGGNGDCFRSLLRSGALGDMKRRGITQLSYFNVDNPLVHCIDELFLGLHDLSDSDMSSKAVPKASAQERVGNFAIADGVLQVIEYSDMPADVAAQTHPDGRLKYSCASIAIHAIRVDFVERLNAGGELRLPWHRAQKKMPCVDSAGQPIKPDHLNAVKLEQFVFDAIPLARSPLVYLTDRAEEFSPVKNAEGNDSPATSQRDQIRRAARWLEAAGVNIPRDSEENVLAAIEISPLFAATAEQLASRKAALPPIRSGDSLYLE